MKVYSGKIGKDYGNKRVLDISVKSGDWVFSPSWDMVMGFKRGELSWSEYEGRYHEMMRNSFLQFRKRWDEVLGWDEVVLVCYCSSDKWCHRRLLKDYLVKCGGSDGGEVPPSPEVKAKPVLPSPPSIKVAFSGHRDIQPVRVIRSWIERIAAKYPDAEIISGGAVCVDQIVAHEAIKAGLRSSVYLPFPYDVMSERWNGSWKSSLRNIMDMSIVRVIQGYFSYAGYHKRNKAMVDDADLVIAVYDDRNSGGTVKCIRYALRVGKRVINAFSGEDIQPSGEVELDGKIYHYHVDRWYDENYIRIPSALAQRLGVGWGGVGAAPSDVPSLEEGYSLNINWNDTTIYTDDATYISSRFKIDPEWHGDGTEGTENKERELASVSQRLLADFQSDDFLIYGGNVFERYERDFYEDTNSIACRLKMAFPNPPSLPSEIVAFLNREVTHTEEHTNIFYLYAMRDAVGEANLSREEFVKYYFDEGWTDISDDLGVPMSLADWIGSQLIRSHELTKEVEVSTHLCCPTDTSQALASMLSVVNKDRDAKMETMWMRKLKADWSSAVNELFEYYKALVECEPSDEVEYSSMDDQRYGDKRFEGLRLPASEAIYGWRKLVDPNWVESDTPVEVLLERWFGHLRPPARAMVGYIRTLKGKKLRSYGAQLYKLQRGIMRQIPSGGVVVKASEISAKEWTTIWGVYHGKKPLCQ